ncbi:MAG: hypothetical protein ABIJ53_07540 [Verrucomicrobiota bacterium]
MGNIDITLLRFGKPEEIRRDVLTQNAKNLFNVRDNNCIEVTCRTARIKEAQHEKPAFQREVY